MSGPCASYPLTPRWVNLHLWDQQNSCRLAVFASLRLPACIAEGGETDLRATCSRMVLDARIVGPVTLSRLISEVWSILTSSTHRNTRSARRGIGGLACHRASRPLSRARSSPFPDQRVDGAKSYLASASALSARSHSWCELRSVPRVRAPIKSRSKPLCASSVTT
jgi:hypothetical protein